MTPFIAGNLSLITGLFITYVAFAAFYSSARRKSRTNDTLPGQPNGNAYSLPWPLLLLRAEVWGAVIGAVLMVRYLSSADHRHLIPSATIGALIGVSCATGTVMLARHRAARRAADAVAKKQGNAGAVP
jgi:hypothetical protein